MFSFGSRRIFVVNETVDMRKSFDTLSIYVEGSLGKDPVNGDVFVFIGKRYNRMKVLVWEDSGFWLLCKRVNQGTFVFNKDLCSPATALSAAEWHMLLEGIVLKKSRKLKRYKR
jgi:transposase